MWEPPLGKYICHAHKNRYGEFDYLKVYVVHNIVVPLFWLDHKIYIGLVRYTVHGKWLYKFQIIGWWYVNKGLIHSFKVEKINFESPYDNLLKLYFIFSFEPKYNDWYANAMFDDTSKNPYTRFIE